MFQQQCDKYWNEMCSTGKHVKHGDIHVYTEHSLFMARLNVRTFRIYKVTKEWRKFIFIIHDETFTPPSIYYYMYLCKILMMDPFIMYKSARSQESQSFTACTISKEQYDMWEWFFFNFDTINTLASCSLRSRAFCASGSRKFSQLTRNALKRIEMQKKNFTPLTDYALCA